MRHSLLRSTCLGLFCATLVITNPISDFRIRARSLNLAKDGEELVENVKTVEVSKGLGNIKMNPIEEEKRLGSEKTLINSENDQNKLDEVERTKVDSHQDQRSKSEKPIDESVSKSPSSSEVESSSSSSSESESESEIKKESQKPTNSLIDKFKEIYQNWKRTIISNWKKNTSMRPLDVGERQRNSETKPGTYLHWYRTSESLLAKLFRGIRRYFTIHKPKPVSGPLEPKVGEKVTSTETKMTESTQEIKSAPEIQKVEKSKDV